MRLLKPCAILFSTLLSFLLSLIPSAVADGNGQLGMGGVFATPRCATVCRGRIADNTLRCSPDTLTDAEPQLNTRGDTHIHEKRRVRFPEPHTPDCYVVDAAFMRTLALCVEKYCEGQDGMLVWEIEKWWAAHVSSSYLLANWTVEARPSMPYGEALRLAKVDVERAGGLDRTPLVDPGLGKSLNVTSLVREEDFRPAYDFMVWYEGVLFSHTRNTVGIVISSVFIPVLFSLLRFLPGRPLWYSHLVAALERPLIGRRHRTPLPGDIGYMPTRGQSLYLLYLTATQIFLAIFPVQRGPNPVRKYELLQLIGERTGVIGMGNFVALFLFSSRNNILLWVTNWSHGTFILLHGWIGYCTIIQVSIHSILLLVPFVENGTHAVEAVKGYWIWGIAGTLVLVLIWPFAILPVRKRMYEAFLASHQILAFATLLCTYYHIFLYFGHDWKFEIWVYVGGLLWAGDRIVRLMRVMSSGLRMATVTPISMAGSVKGDEGSDEGHEPPFEYIRFDVDGIVVPDGHVYAYFPTLSWRFWENHPFSVLGTFTSGTSTAALEFEKSSSASTALSASRPSTTTTIRPRMTIIFRPENGLTRTIATRLLASPSKRLTLPILVEAVYHSNPTAKSDITHCSTLLCFAGGVGVTAVVPLLKTFGGVRSRLCWGVRDTGLVTALESEFIAPLHGVQVQTIVGKRMDVREILREELVDRDGEEKGDLGVVVCGPAGMADDVRLAVAEYGANSGRGVVFVDEAFSW